MSDGKQQVIDVNTEMPYRRWSILEKKKKNNS